MRKAVQTRRATDAEKVAYAAIKPTPLYPLSHYIKVAGEWLVVEYLGGEWSKENPQYEAIAPKGHHFKYDDTHTMFGLTLKALKERLVGASFEACGDQCRRGNR
jgi:hypothetical protein